MTDELRKYAALTVALICGILVSVAMFVVSLNMEMRDAYTRAAYESSIAATLAENYLSSLVTEAVGFSTLMDVAGEAGSSLRALPDGSNLRDVAVAMCRIDGDRIDMESIGGVPGARDACSEATSVRMQRLDGYTRFDAYYGLHGADDPTTASLLLGIDTVDDTRFLFSIPASRLLASLKANLKEHVSIVGVTCFSAYWNDDPVELGCSGDLGAAAIEPIANDRLIVQEVAMGGWPWRVTLSPDALVMSQSISATPFVVLLVFLVVSGFGCYWVFTAVGKNISLSKQHAKLSKTAETLSNRNTELDQFAYMASHDLQTPLRFIVSRSHMLLEDVEDQRYENVPEIARAIVQQGERMRELVLDLLAFCRAGQSELNYEEVNLVGMLNDEIELLRANNLGEGVDVRLDGVPPQIRADRSVLEQIFRNLLTNAFKYGGDGAKPVVTVTAERKGRRWEFSVHDNGPGIAPDHQERIFQPFQRLHTDIDGSGVGLSIVSKLVERHGGRIRVESDPHEGRVGTTFHFAILEPAPDTLTLLSKVA